MKTQVLKIDGASLTIETIGKFIESNCKIELTKQSEKKISLSRKLVDDWVKREEAVYGVTTGFGEFSNIKISNEDIEILQENLILSHSVGAGKYLPPFIVKIMMLLRVNALAKGYSGIKIETLKLLIKMINNNVIPAVPSQGSVGSSGDLVQLSHLVLALIGKGKVQIFDKVNRESNFCENWINSSDALTKLRLTPLRLAAKEGLALINGTQMMTSFASYICYKAKRLIKIADICGSLSHEALRGTDKAFDLKLHKLRPYPGQIASAKNLLKMIAKSQIRASHLKNDQRVQDAYSLRCMPQIHGASRDAINYACSQISIEINSANDNPLIFSKEKEHIEGGNFHGQPVALPMDFLAIALSELANVSERRIERLVNGALSGLPRFLIKNGGLNSGLMIAQYTAASLVSENKVLAHPASVDSIPTSANQEDHNSMGSISAQKCFRIMENLETVLAIEAMTASQAIEFLKPLKCGKGTLEAYNYIRNFVSPLNEDRILYDDVQKVLSIIRNDSLLETVEKIIDLI